MLRLFPLAALALVLALVSPALAENPDGPVGLLTFDVLYAPTVAWGEDIPPGSSIIGFEDVGGSDFRLGVLAPVTSWLTLGGDLRRSSFSEDLGGGDSSDFWQMYLGIRARVHVPLTAHAKRAITASTGE